MSRSEHEDTRVIEKDFQRAVTAFFGVPIRIEERALKAFCIWRGSSANQAKNPRPLHIWSQIEKEVPAVQQFYELLSLEPPNPKQMGFPKAERRSITKENYDSIRFNWGETLHSIFGNPRSEYFTQPGTRIRKARVLSIRDLVPALIDVTGEQLRASEAPFINLKRSLLGQLIRRATGFSQTANHLEAFSQHATEQWEKVCELDPFLGNQQFIILDSPDGYRVLPFAVLGGYRIAEDEDVTWQARANVLQPIWDRHSDQIEELESLINSRSPEQDFQRFFEKYPHFLTNIGPYQRVHSQLILHRDGNGSLIPDFFLEKIDSDFCDICDLKLPTQAIVRHQKNRTRFRDAIMEGLAQLTHYREWFDSQENRIAFNKQHGLNSYRPRAVLVVGRRASFSTEMERLQLESGLPNWFQLLTYDEILSRTKHWRHLSQNSEPIFL